MTTDSAHDAGWLRGALLAAADGNAEAAERFYEVTSPTVFGTALMVLRTEDSAAEVTRRTYERAWAQAYRLDGGDPTGDDVMSWLVGLAHRLAVEQARSQQDLPTRLPGRHAAGVDLTPRRNAQGVITQIAPPGSELLRLTYLDGYTLDEVAALHASDPESVSSTIITALRNLRAQVTPHRP